MTGPLEGEDLPGGRDDAARRQRRSSGLPPSRCTCATASATRASFVSAADVARARRRPPHARRCGRPKNWRPPCLRGHGGAADLEGDGQPQCAGGGRSADVHDVELSAPQQPGMWFQVELPEAVRLTEIQFESPGRADAAVVVAAGPRPSARGVTRYCASGHRAAGSHFGGRSCATGTRRPRRRRSRRPRRRLAAQFKVEVSMDGTSWGRRWRKAREGDSQP